MRPFYFGIRIATSLGLVAAFWPCAEARAVPMVISATRALSPSSPLSFSCSDDLEFCDGTFTDPASAAFSQFDSSLGTLVKVSIHPEVTSFLIARQIFSFAAQLDISTTHTLGAPQLGDLSTLIGSVPLLFDTFTISEFGPEPSGFNLVDRSPTFEFTGSDVLPFASPAPQTFFFPLSVSVDGHTDLAGIPRGGSAEFGSTGWITVTYTFEPFDVPEPSSVFLIGWALLGLAMRRRRR